MVQNAIRLITTFLFCSYRIRKSYLDARADCLSKGGDLTSITNLPEQDFIHISIQKLSHIDW